ncbi:hypothetical protein FQR65_LT02117 [Abscondita terminalis]|nr:hypothetical protein FQR65_LT02117 [Abscondita terminalis]
MFKSSTFSIYLLDTRTNSNPSCNFANASSLRADCGWYGISYSQCTEQGCCFDAATETHAPGSPHCFCSHNHPYYSEEDRSEGKKRRMQVELTFDGQTFVEICKCISIDVGEDRQKPAINVKCSSLKLELNKSKDKSKMKVIGCTKENPRKAKFGQHIIDSGLYSTVSPQDVGWVMECQYRSSRDIRTCDNFVGNEEIFYEKLLQKIGSEMCQMKPSTHCPRKDYVNDNCKDYPFKFDIFDPESN